MNPRLHSLTFIGSSSVYGEMDDHHGGYVGRITTWFAAHNRTVIINKLGNPGETTEDMLKRIKHQLSAISSTVIFLHIGTNDTAHHTKFAHNDTKYEDFERNVEQLIFTAQEFAQEIKILTPTPVDDSKNPHKYGTYFYNTDIEQYTHNLVVYCEKRNIDCINLFDYLLQHERSSYLYEDGLHLNPNGHEIVKNIILETLKQQYLF